MANEGRILSKFPDEIWLNIISNLDDELDQIVLSRACRRTRNLFPPRHFAVATKYWKEEQLESFRLRQWVDLMGLGDTLQLLGKAACGPCKKAHDMSAFETEMLAKLASDRACKGATGLFRVCEHKVLKFEDVKAALQSEDSRLLCGKHPQKKDTYDERIFWDMVSMKDPKKKEIKVVSDDKSNVIGIWTGYACMATGYDRALEREALEDILATDTTPICRHLRRCDLMATLPQDEDHRARDMDNPMFCSHPSCLSTYRFADSEMGTVSLEVVRYLGMARSPSDPYWLEAINEMRVVEDIDATEQMQADRETEVDTADEEEDDVEEETVHPLFDSYQKNIVAQRGAVSAASGHSSGDDYPKDSDDCMCAGTCSDCDARSRGIPQRRLVSKLDGLGWVHPGDVGYYVYRYLEH